MAHLTCEMHGKRSLVIETATGPLTRVLHRSDGTLCGDMGRDYLKYRGHTITPFSVLVNSFPKTQKLTRKQEREAEINKGIDLNRSSVG